MALIFVDCEAVGPSPSTGYMTEFGAVEYETRQTFHAILDPNKVVQRQDEPMFEALIVGSVFLCLPNHHDLVYQEFDRWVTKFPGRPVFISDNPAFDWQWINDGFHVHLGRNPFGHSARRIGDFYAGLKEDFYTPGREWKKLRVTPHDHNPVHDALGNCEAFERMMKGER